MPSLTLMGQMNDILSSSNIPQTLTHRLLGPYPEQVAFVCASPRGPNRARFREKENCLSTKGPWH